MKKPDGRILFFDSTNFDWLHFALIDSSLSGQTANKTAHQKVRIRHFESEKTLPALLAFLKKHGIKPTNSNSVSNSRSRLQKISKIYFVSGPGSFSGIRVGASIALALGFGWGVPVFTLTKSAAPNGFNAKILAQIKAGALKAKKISSVPELDYGAAPKITKEKKKNLRNT